MHKCKQCGEQFNSLDGLRRHSARIHKISSKELYNQIILEGNLPKCKCGCGETPKFMSFEVGYKEWIRGHISRIHNNWGHNQIAIENSSNTRRKQYKNGERKVWNDGLTKETDERVKEYSEKSRNAIITNENEIKRRSVWLSHARKNKKQFKSKYGKHSANWKGGASSINNLVRVNKQLYEEWKYPILKRDAFRCVKCGNNKELEVHHNGETMSEILSKFMDKEKDYKFNQKRRIMKKVIDYHIQQKVDGETLCKSCHCKLHPSYNY